MLPIFDAHVRAEALTAPVIERLTYFNVRTVLVAAHAPRRFETSEDLLGYFADLVSTDLVRIQQGGLSAFVALGVHPRAVPRRTHYEIWRELPVALADPAVVAVGELCLEQDDRSQESLLAKQLALACDLGLPVLITAGAQERARRVRTILSLVESAGLPPQRVLINHNDYTSLRPVLDAGCWAGLTVGPQHLPPSDALELMQRYGRSAIEQVILTSGLREGAQDVLALPKMALGLSDAGFSASDLRRVCFSNASRVFGLRSR